jgi:hypothetical protein
MSSVARMTQKELRELIGETVEEKPIELLGDPDEGLVIRRSLRTRLLRQRRGVANGERGESLAKAVRSLSHVGGIECTE